MAKIEIDSVEYEAPEGKKLFDFLVEKGFEIPHLCYHPSLESIGACRMCTVEVEGMRTLPTSCTIDIKDGMKIKTDSQRVENARKMNLSFILGEHPNECMTCDQNGNCRLQTLAYRYYPQKEPPFGFLRTKDIPLDDSNEFIIRDMNKCVKCQLCVRVCDEIENMSIYSMTRRGHSVLPSTPQDLPLGETDCVSCGQCATICPVGAIIEKPSIGKAHWTEVEKTKTTCVYCGVGCQLDVYTEPRKNEIVRVQASKENPEVNDGVATCVKGKFGYEFVNHKDRLTDPKVRRSKDEELISVGWDEALEYTANRLSDIKEKYGPDSIAFLSSARCSNEENYLLQKISRAVIGTNNVDHCARLCHASTVAGLAMTFGSGAMTNNLSDISESDVILLTGSNPTENHPVYGSRIKKAVRNGATLIVADPRRIELVDHAALWLRHLPGTDVALFNGLLHVIVKEYLHDEKFISDRTEDFEALVKTVEKYTPEYVSRVTKVPAEDIVEAARIYGNARSATIIYAMGITQHVSGTNNVISLANLSMATGNVGRPGAGLNPLRGQGNVQGAGDMGALPNVFPGYQKVTDGTVIEKFKKAWGVERLSDQNGLTIVEMMDAILEGKIKALFVMGENPRLSDPDALHVEEALKKVDFLVSMDIFPNETNRYADVILAASSGFEKDGTFTNTERRAQLVRPVIKPVGNSLPDWVILKELSNRLGYEMSYDHPSRIMDEIASVTPIYGGMAYSRMEEKGLQWPCVSHENPGTPILHAEKFSRPNGKGKFIPVEFAEPPELPDADFPFYLSTGRILYHYHTGTMTRRVKGLNNVAPGVEIEINPLDAERLKISKGDIVKVTSRRGFITGKAKLTRRSLEGMVFIPFHYAEAAANELTLAVLDPISKIPTYKVAAVQVEKVADGIHEEERPEKKKLRIKRMSDRR